MAMEPTTAIDQSYPPVFRRPNSPPPPMGSPDHHRTGIEIPTVDMQDLDSARLGEACRKWGAFRLANHGSPHSRLLDEARGVLSLPFETKRAEFTQPIPYFWGTPRITQPVRNLNWFEGLNVPVGRLQSGEVAEDPDSGSCSSSSSFRCLVVDYGRHMERIARTLFDAMAFDLNLGNEQSASYLSESDGTIRVYRYLRCPDASNCMGLDAHTDSSVLSILNQDEVGGLQILHDNRWLDVEPIPDTLVVVLGDIMQAISNDEYKSVEHRVVASSSRERISLCYFGFPMEDGVIISSRYRAFTCKDFRAQVQEDIKNTGFKVGLERFRIINPS